MKHLIIIILVSVIYPSLAKAQELKFQPPWNNPPESAINFTIDGIDNIPDLYGDIVAPQLVVFFAGNQFMVLEELISAFKQEYPQYQRVFVETLPPGILAQQIEKGSLTIGNMRITLKPDIYTAGTQRIAQLKDKLSETRLYAKNKLSLMVQLHNPKNIKGLKDLNVSPVRISMPNPEWEGIARLIIKAYENAGGKELVKAVMDEKVKNGTTFLTKIHHRQSPLRILNNLSDVAPVWHTEVAFQKMKGHPVDEITIPDAENEIASYYAGILKDAPHQQAAKDFLNFLTSAEGQRIYNKYGFITN